MVQALLVRLLLILVQTLNVRRLERSQQKSGYIFHYTIQIKLEGSEVKKTTKTFIILLGQFYRKWFSTQHIDAIMSFFKWIVDLTALNTKWFDTPKVFTESDQETFLTIMSKTQRGRMDEQRCTLNISPKSTPAHSPTKDVSHKGLNLLPWLLHPIFSCSWYIWDFSSNSSDCLPLPRCRSRKVFFSVGQLSGQAAGWPAAFSAFIAWNKDWKYKLNFCYRGRCRKPVQRSR